MRVVGLERRDAADERERERLVGAGHEAGRTRLHGRFRDAVDDDAEEHRAPLTVTLTMAVT